MRDIEVGVVNLMVLRREEKVLEQRGTKLTAWQGWTVICYNPLPYITCPETLNHLNRLFISDS
jgi:hypothetical protein